MTIKHVPKSKVIFLICSMMSQLKPPQGLTSLIPKAKKITHQLKTQLEMSFKRKPHIGTSPQFHHLLRHLKMLTATLSSLLLPTTQYSNHQHSASKHFKMSKFKILLCLWLKELQRQRKRHVVRNQKYAKIRLTTLNSQMVVGNAANAPTTISKVEVLASDARSSRM